MFGLGSWETAYFPGDAGSPLWVGSLPFFDRRNQVDFTPEPWKEKLSEPSKTGDPRATEGGLGESFSSFFRKATGANDPIFVDFLPVCDLITVRNPPFGVG